MDNDIDDVQMIGYLLGLVLVPLLMWGVRRHLLSYLKSRMFVDSGEQTVSDTALSGEVHGPAGAPRFEWHTAQSAAPEGAAGLAERERAASRMFNRGAAVDLAFAIAYAAATALANVLFVFLIVARWIMHREAFRAADLRRMHEPKAAPGRLVRLLKLPVRLLAWYSATGTWREASRPRWRFAITLAMILSVLVSPFLDPTPGVLIAVVIIPVHVAVLLWELRVANRTPGLGLLVLRVFNDPAASSFLFSGLMNRWRYFGHHYTVVDGSLVQQARDNSKVRRNLILLGSLAALFVAFTNIGALIAERRAAAPGLVLSCALIVTLALAGAGAVVFLGRLRIDGLFVRSRGHLLARLARIDRKPRHLDLSFRHLRAPCHNNVWFMAVHEFAKRSQVVLMDLRSFTAEREGCRTEMEFLFNAVPVDRVLFLVGDANADAATSAMQEIWRRQRAASPNRDLAEPVLHVFRCAANDAYDMQAILQWLVEAAERDPAVRGVRPAPAQPPEPQPVAAG